MSLFLPDILVWPFLASLVLAGIHVYFGIHVIARNVIFVDLAIAQLAALGAVVGIFFGYEHGRQELAIYLYSLAFTFLGAVIFTLSRSRKQTVPLEAIIGITYTAAFAMTLMILAKSPIGSHELDRVLKGDILWVEKGKVLVTAAVYAAVGLIHFIMRKRFLELSLSYEGGADVPRRTATDLLFYMTFGAVVASSVSLVGVFLVFSYLVLPSVTSILIFPDIRRRLIFGWILAGLVSFAGMKLSYSYELPSTPLIVILFTAVLLVAAFVRKLMLAGRRVKALAGSAGTLCALGLFVFMLYKFRAEEAHDELKHLLEHGTSQERVYALRMLKQEGKVDASCGEWISRLAREGDVQVKLAVCELLKILPAGGWEDEIMAMLEDSGGELLRCLLDLGRRRKIRGFEERLLARARLERSFDAKLELFEALLDMHNKEVVDCMIDNYSRFPGALQGDILELLNSHYHTGAKTIDEFRSWFGGGK